MSSSVRAHYDGKQVILDEPAPFAPGEELIICRSTEATLEGFPTSVVGNQSTAARPATPLDAFGSRPERGAGLLERLAREQGVDRFNSFSALVEGIGEPEPDEADLWTIVEQHRKERRQAASEKDDLEWFR